MINIAVFASGNGTNCENIIRYFAQSDHINVALVLCNKSGARVAGDGKRRMDVQVAFPKNGAAAVRNGDLLVIEGAVVADQHGELSLPDSSSAGAGVWAAETCGKLQRG